MMRLMYFNYNWPRDFLDKAFKDSPVLDHIKDKFHGYYEQYGASQAFFKLLMAMDRENQRIMLTYILDNYSDEVWEDAK